MPSESSFLISAVPLFFKKCFINLNTDKINAYVNCYSVEGYEKFSTDTKNNYELASKEFNYKDTKKFTYIHINGCHEADYDDNWELSPYLTDRAVSVLRFIKHFLKNSGTLLNIENAVIDEAIFFLLSTFL